MGRPANGFNARYFFHAKRRKNEINIEYIKMAHYNSEGGNIYGNYRCPHQEDRC